MAAAKTSEHEGIEKETIQNETHRENRIQKNLKEHQ